MNCLLCNSNTISIKYKFSQPDLARLWRGIYPLVDEELKLKYITLYECNTCKLKFFDPQLAGGDRFYSELGKLEWYYLHEGKTEYDYVQKYIRNGDKILDIGAGRGVFFTKIKASVEYTGLELSTKAVELATASGINVIQENLINHAVEHKENYDLVCLFQVLEHLTELDVFLKCVYASLKNNGLFVIAVPDNDGFISYTTNYTFNLPPHHTTLWTEASLRYLAKTYGFEVVDIERELLQDVHKDYAYQAYYTKIIQKLFFQRNLLIDYRLSYRIIFKIVRILLGNRAIRASLIPLISVKSKYGQSILVTLKKM